MGVPELAVRHTVFYPSERALTASVGLCFADDPRPQKNSWKAEVAPLLPVPQAGPGRGCGQADLTAEAAHYGDMSHQYGVTRC